MVDSWGTASGPTARQVGSTVQDGPASSRTAAGPSTSRHALRTGRAADPRRGRPAPRQAPAARVEAAPARRRTNARVALSALVMTFAAGLVLTLALPSYAVDPAKLSDQRQAAGRTVAEGGEQQLARVRPDVQAAAIGRDTFTATTSAELRRRAYAQQYSSYTGPTAADYIKNPAHPPFSLSAVYQTALQYRGVPYVFGGADPSGFDCSGFVMFVYAQYGVALPHSVHEQDGMAMQISPADAQVGDVVVFNDDSHDGFYAGNGMILHAPYPGASVRVQPLWTSDVHFVRFGAN